MAPKWAATLMKKGLSSKSNIKLKPFHLLVGVRVLGHLPTCRNSALCLVTISPSCQVKISPFLSSLIPDSTSVFSDKNSYFYLFAENQYHLSTVRSLLLRCLKTSSLLPIRRWRKCNVASSPATTLFLHCSKNVLVSFLFLSFSLLSSFLFPSFPFFFIFKIKIR